MSAPAGWWLLLVLAPGLAACPAGSPADCAVSCGAGESCPDGFDCVDGRCRAAGESEPCAPGGGDDAGGTDEEADAGPAAADADPQVACARICYDELAYCDQAGLCAQPDQTCELAIGTQYPMDEQGPLIHSAVQVDNESKSDVLCKVGGCDGGGSLCAIRFGWFDPQPDVEGPALQSRVYFVEPSGDVNPTEDEPTLDAGEIEVRGCFAAGAFEGAIQIQDSGSHMSNPVCFTGIAEGP